jgi:hypothetical protein
MNNEKSMQQNILESLHETGFVKISQDEILIHIKKDEKKEISLDDFLQNMNNYVESCNIVIYLLLIEYIELKNYECIKKIIDKKILPSQYFDSIINHILSSENCDTTLIKLIYEEITEELREFTLANCISKINNNELVEWVFERLDDEAYFDLEKIFSMVENVSDFMFEQIIQKSMFKSIQNELFRIMFLNISNAQIFMNHYEKEYGKDELQHISEDNKITVLIYCCMTHNKNLCKLLLDNIKLNPENIYMWLSLFLEKERFEMIDYVMENGNIKKIDEKMTISCLALCGERISCSIVKYLFEHKTLFENLNLTCNDNSIFRNAIISENIDIVEFLLENKIYSDRALIEENELLNDTIEFFASEEISELINKYLGES